MAALRFGVCLDARVLARPQRSPLLARLDLVAFPELVDGGYAALKRGGGRHSIGDPFLKLFRDASAEFGITVIAGSVHLAGTHSTNTSLVFRNGRLVHRYDKIHLFRPLADHRYFRPGRIARTFPLVARAVNIRAGIEICYDLRFPELTRELSLHRMRLLVVPARWPAARDDAWMTLLKARAIENQIFVVGCNARGIEGGSSYAFDPSGELVWTNRGRRAAPIAVFSLDMDRVAQAHRFHSNLKEAVLLRRQWTRP